MGLPHPWDGNRDIRPKEQFKKNITGKRNTNLEDDKLESVATREKVIKRIGHKFQIWIQLKRIFKEMDPMSY